MQSSPLFRVPHLRMLATLLLILSGWHQILAGTTASGPLELVVRKRVSLGESWRVQVSQQAWDPRETAIVVCDMWNYHHSYNATQRVGELAVPMNRVLAAARERGILIIHAPSSCMEAYRDHPARQRALDAPNAKNLPTGITDWCARLPQEEAATYPIDDLDGGEDDEPSIRTNWHKKLAEMGHTPGSPWTRQIDLLDIDPERDIITDSGVENWNVQEQHGIRHVIVMGVHTNMCVLGRPFGLRQMAQNGRDVVLMRDMTDTMYNPAQRPFVSHFTGTDLIVEHIEKFICPTVTSNQFLGAGKPFQFTGDRRRHLVMLIADDEYNTYDTLPRFAVEHLGHDFRVTYVHDDPTNMHQLHDLEALQEADLVLVSARRRMLSIPQLDLLRAFVESGKPVVGIRTASHAFASRGEPATEGHAYWPEFDADVLGGNYQGHHGNKGAEDPHTYVQVPAQAATHPIVRGLPTDEFLVPSWLYKTSPLGPRTTLLMTGRVEGRQPPEPVTWTNTDKFGGRVFYTSLGHPGDFELASFRQLLRGGIYWAAELEVPPRLAGTQPLNKSGDIASELVDTADSLLLREIERAKTTRESHWKRDLSNATAYDQSLAPHRERLGHLLGLGDPRHPATAPQLIATTTQPARVAIGRQYEALAIRWPVFGSVYGEGLLLEPTHRQPIANVIALPHCDFAPEEIAGLGTQLGSSAHYARRLAESGCRVIVPFLIDRGERLNGISQREWLHRAAFEMGRTMTGYEVAKVQAVVDWYAHCNETSNPKVNLPIGIVGWGDGGMIAAYTAALDPRVTATCISGAWGELDNLWQQPADRMVFSVLAQWGDAQLAAMIAPRNLIIETGTQPTTDHPRSGTGGAPYKILKPAPKSIQTTAAEARELVSGLAPPEWLTVMESEPSRPGSEGALQSLLHALVPAAQLAPLGELPAQESHSIDRRERQARQISEIDRHTQDLLRDSHRVRKARFWDKLDTSSLAAYEASIAPFRQELYDEVVGRLDLPIRPPRPRTRLIEETSKWRRYEVVLDVWDELFAYGLLTVPRDIVPGEKRPVVVCQHGLEGRPQSVIGEQDYAYYKGFATELAEQGLVTFAPQNLYIFEDRFRTLQRKANTLGKTLFSLITPQHQQIVDWLQSLPFVDPEQVAFYGLSYGGKTAMRVPPLVTDYCLSICSADFNEWVDKNASTRNPRSYVNSGEYEIFEWNLGPTFNYAEMAALIAPRPFMVERGHWDGVSDDWTVAWEYARVRFLYAALLKIPERTEIEWFDGPHSIHGEGTYDFLRKHLNWPKPH